MWRFKYLLIGMILPALIGVGGYFAAPRAADALRDAVRDGASHAVAETFTDETPNRIQAGQVVITEADLATAIENTDRREDGWNVSGLDVIIEDGRVRIVGSDNDRNSRDDLTVASAVPQVVNDEFVLTDRSGAVSIFKTATDAIADEVEVQVASLFQRSGVVPISVTAENGRLVIVTEAQGSNGAGGNATAEATSTVAATPAAQAQATSTAMGGLFRLRTPTPTP